ncbi:hypothetical protein Droror1_Dr00013891 [Drosera rotundifolia]
MAEGRRRGKLDLPGARRRTFLGITIRITLRIMTKAKTAWGPHGGKTDFSPKKAKKQRIVMHIVLPYRDTENFPLDVSKLGVPLFLGQSLSSANWRSVKGKHGGAWV